MRSSGFSAFSPYAFNAEDAHVLWSQIACPTLLIRGTESWASDPAVDGRLQHFQDARVVNIENAGHWVHHDQLSRFLAVVNDFLES